ncbi:MAG: hypothetical protein LBV61_11165, partial [Burkholderiaceae bacterium]|nr:hypothetical protein [Burkholderiaceae bacterium]
ETRVPTRSQFAGNRASKLRKSAVPSIKRTKKLKQIKMFGVLHGRLVNRRPQGLDKAWNCFANASQSKAGR